MEHFALAYAKRINEILHSFLISTWFYKHQIYEVPEVCTALLITYENQNEDEFEINTKMDWDNFLKRMSVVKPNWKNFSLQIMKQFAEYPQNKMGGWEGRTIYIIRGGNNPGSWRGEVAEEDIFTLLVAAYQMWGMIIEEEANNVDELIPARREHFKDYENFVRVVINYLFIPQLGEAKIQVRTEPGTESVEIRDLICQNRAHMGFWKDLKDKYACSEILFDAKNKLEITKDDLQQIYSYLKPAIGLGAL